MNNFHSSYMQTVAKARLVRCLLVMLIAVQFTACKKFVEVEAPRSQLLGSLVFEEYGTALAALSGVYTQLRDGNYAILYGGSMGMTTYLGQAADELRSYSNQNQTFGENFYKNSVFADSEDIFLLWTSTYNQIYNANSIMEGVEKSTKLTQPQKDQITGEALFIRAMLHFYLTNLYGDVPYIVQTEYLLNKDLDRMSSTAVYDKVIADLTTAEQLLAEDYPSDERVRINKYTAKALLARVYLYLEDWEKAEAMATDLLDHNAVYTWVEDPTKVFLKESTGTIWALKAPLEGINAEEAWTHIILSSPLSGARSINTPLLDAFEPGDLRKQHWIGSYSEDGNTWYFAYKYKERNSTTTSKEYSVVMRIEEQYLIRAEARAEQDNITGAQQDINKLRGRAGLPDTDASTKETLLDAVLHERQVELFTEFGHRWFDLKRRGKLDAVLGAVKANWNTEDQLLPIPEKELLVNPSLNPQNPGY